MKTAQQTPHSDIDVLDARKAEGWTAETLGSEIEKLMKGKYQHVKVHVSNRAVFEKVKPKINFGQPDKEFIL